MVNRNEDLAICFANLKGQRAKDLLGTAKALSRLKTLPEYKTNSRLGRTLGVSGEIVRQFLSLLALPTEVQDFLRDGKLGLEHGRRLAQLQSKTRDSQLTVRVATEMVGMSAHDGRAMVEHLLGHPGMSAEEARQAIAQSKPIEKHTYAIVASLDANLFNELRGRAATRKVSVNDLVKSIVERWLGEND